MPDVGPYGGQMISVARVPSLTSLVCLLYENEENAVFQLTHFYFISLMAYFFSHGQTAS